MGQGGARRKAADRMMAQKRFLGLGLEQLPYSIPTELEGAQGLVPLAQATWRHRAAGKPQAAQ